MKKATRDLNQLLNNIESPLTRLETVHKKYIELLSDMKKLDRDYAKSKKRADQVQKDQEKGYCEKPNEGGGDWPTFVSLYI